MARERGDKLSPYMNAVTRSVRDALVEAPVSLRELARRTGVSHAQIARIVAGERSATPLVALAVAKALDAISAEAAKSAERVRRSITTHQRRK